jgi:2'-5' RNA ligase
MRTFITFEFDKAVKNKIYDVQQAVKDNSYSGRFKYKDNFHLTLKFLGEAGSEVIENICNDMKMEFTQYHPFIIDLSGIGAFGAGDKIKTIYIKSSGETGELFKIHNTADEITSKYGFKKEGRFSPHITIAQDVLLKIPYSDLENKLNYSFYNNIVFDKIVIMKSEQILNKRVYTPIKTIILNDSK